MTTATSCCGRHPALAKPISLAQLTKEVSRLARRAGLLGRIHVSIVPRLHQAHLRSCRRYADTTYGPPMRIDLAPEMLLLPKGHRLGLLAHELGHAMLMPEGHTEADADAEGESILGPGWRISYDRRWPGKGLQLATKG